MLWTTLLWASTQGGMVSLYLEEGNTRHFGRCSPWCSGCQTRCLASNKPRYQIIWTMRVFDVIYWAGARCVLLGNTQYKYYQTRLLYYKALQWYVCRINYNFDFFLYTKDIRDTHYIRDTKIIRGTTDIRYTMDIRDTNDMRNIKEVSNLPRISLNQGSQGNWWQEGCQGYLRYLYYKKYEGKQGYHCF